MTLKKLEKEKAIQLRKEGKTYNEILSLIPVAKSTLSLWLRDFGLSKRQIQRITEKKLVAIRKGAEGKRNQRILKTNILLSKAREQIDSISDRELFLIGVTLYWAEGSKERVHRTGSIFQFGNMDPFMILVMLEWLKRVCKIDKTMIGFELYLHETHRYRLDDVLRYWAKILEIPVSAIKKVYFKKSSIRSTNRKNVGETYFGLLRLRVPKSTDLVRTVAGWTEGIVEQII